MNWNLPASRYDEIRATVVDFIEDWGITVYPFAIWDLLRKMQIRPIPYSSLPLKAKAMLLEYYPDAITIYPKDFNPARIRMYYNDATSRERIRFTLAHELGHLALGHPGTNKKEYEHEADLFASYLLAPSPLIMRDSSMEPTTISYDFVVSHRCAAVAADRTRKRYAYGPTADKEYESRILTSCYLEKEGERIA